ncbi:protein sprouty homolog 3 [Palaemon carinicauda]|uniref:protein sprouty homolog 3 n=1 Tax=Palaemon carinicauda TaxID=392227 RepID=UPI0035B67A48
MSQDGRSQGGGGAGGCGGSATNTSPQGSPITLSVPRPDHQRTTNLYVDTPFKHRVAPRSRPQHHHLHHHHHHHTSSSLSSSSSSPSSGRTLVDLALVHGAPARTSGKRPTKLMSPTGSVTGAPFKGGNNNNSSITTSSISTNITSSSSSAATLQQSGSRTPVISKQPAALTFTKGRRDDTSDGESIICSWCGRCRCEACTTPRPPPAAWLCRNKCLCSPAAAVDYASCLCCVKGVLYHCGKDGENGLAVAADHPCSCGGPHAMLSWACMAVASIPLPCLLCYWPLTGARRVVETTYQRCTSHGCRCPQGRNPRLQPPPPPPPEKRPLHDCA